MRGLRIDLWKEWRDQRGMCCAILVALPVLVALALWGFGEEIPRGTFGAFALFLLPVCQALFVLAVASELFGGERRRGTLDFTRRLPAGLKSAFLAKVGAYLLGTIFALAWGALVAYAACRVAGPERAAGDFLALLVLPDPLTAALCVGLALLGLWALFLSTFVPQGGAATVGAALLLALLCLPLYLALRPYPWLLGRPNQLLPGVPGLAPYAALLFGVTPLVALAVAFLRGNRFLKGVWAPAWRGLAVVAVMAGGVYAAGASALARLTHIDPGEPEFRIAGGNLGAGGRYLFLNVYRGPNPYYAGDPLGVNAGTPPQPWIVDLSDGSWRVAGAYGESWLPTTWDARFMPQPILRRGAGTPVGDVGWFDGRTAALHKVLPSDVRTPELQRWLRREMPALAWHRDAQGRALWVEGKRLVREGEDAPLEAWVRGREESYVGAVDGGWLGSTVVWDKDHRQASAAWWLLEAATGEARKADRYGGLTHCECPLSTRLALRRKYDPTHKGPNIPLLPWTLVDWAGGGPDAPALNPPPDRTLRAWLPGERVLVMSGEEPDAKVLSAWNPRTGDMTPLSDQFGQPLVGSEVFASQPLPGPRYFLTVIPGRNRPNEGVSVLLDGASGRAWRLPGNGRDRDLLAIDGESDVWCVVDRRRVVHFQRSVSGESPGEWSVVTVFPRP